jgi:hypothetical protein
MTPLLVSRRQEITSTSRDALSAVYREFQSGARQIAFDLDGAGCKATVIDGRRPGDKLLPQMASGRTFEASSAQIGVSCLVSRRQVFAQ